MIVIWPFSDNTKHKIVDIGNISTNTCIENVYCIEGLKFKFLSINQLCDRVHKAIKEPMHMFFYESNPYDLRRVVKDYDIDLVRKVIEITIDNSSKRASVNDKSNYENQQIDVSQKVTQQQWQEWVRDIRTTS